MVIVNEEKAALHNKAKELTKKVVDTIYERKNIKGFYDSLDDSVKALITQSNFQKLLTRLHKNSDNKDLSRIKDSESGVSLRISQSQLFTYEILKKLEIDTDKFFSLTSKEDIENFELPNNQFVTENSPDALTASVLAELNDKLDFVTDCVNRNKRAACSTLFNELFIYTITIRKYMEIVSSNMEEEPPDFRCDYYFMYFILNEVRNLGFRNNKLLLKTEEIGKSGIDFEKQTPLLVYSVLALLVYLKKLLLFISAYKSSHKKSSKTPIIIDEEERKYLSKGEDEEIFIDGQIKRIFNEALQIIDASRLKQEQKGQEYVKRFIISVNKLMNAAGEIFFHQQMFKIEAIENYLEKMANFSAWSEKIFKSESNSTSDKEPKPEYYRLYITKDFAEALKNIQYAVEDYDPDGED